MIVVDASVVIKWILQDETYREKALILLKRHTDSIEKIIVPDLLIYEISNTLVTKPALSVSHITSSLNAVVEFALEKYYPDLEDILKICRLAREYKTTVYDMTYAYIAQRKNMILITADERFVQKTRFPFVKLISDLTSMV